MAHSVQIDSNSRDEGSRRQLSCDVAIIGAGTAGLAAARSAKAAGAEVLLIDDRFAGTMCANIGCMPSKLLIAASRKAHDVFEASSFGITAGEVQVDGEAVLQRVRGMRDDFAAAARKSFDEFGSHALIRGRAKFLSPASLEIDDGTVITAKSIVVATGARPEVPEAFLTLGELCKTHETIFEIDDLPTSLAVVGTGPIGLELAQAFARLGVATALLDESPTIGAVKDQRMHDLIRHELEKELDLILGVEIKAERTAEGAMLNWSGKHDGGRVFDLVLIATGRPPEVDDLDLRAAGLALDDKGSPKYDRETMQCGNSQVFIAGDAVLDSPVLHEAVFEGSVAGGNAARFPDVERHRRKVHLSIVFHQPPVVMVGREPDDATIIGTASYQDQGRAKVEREAIGAVSIYAEPTRGRVTGASLFCPDADHIGHLLALAVERGTTAAEMLALPIYHPTIEEGLKDALRQICAKVPSSGDYDLNVPAGS